MTKSHKKLIGLYCLVIDLPADTKICFNKSPRLFKKGYYIYVGSALGGLFARISRHLRINKKIYWHIDRLLDVKGAFTKTIFYLETDKKDECRIADILKKRYQGIEGFGCSDCVCQSHLFYLGLRIDKEKEKNIKRLIGMKQIEPGNVKKLEK